MFINPENEQMQRMPKFDFNKFEEMLEKIEYNAEK